MTPSLKVCGEEGEEDFGRFFFPPIMLEGDGV